MINHGILNLQILSLLARHRPNPHRRHRAICEHDFDFRLNWLPGIHCVSGLDGKRFCQLQHAS